MLSVIANIQKSIESSLNSFFTDNVYHYTNCCEKGKNICEKNSITHLPNLLIINVKRFTFTQSTNTFNKDESPIIFKQFLHLNSFLSPDATVHIISQSRNDVYFLSQSNYHS